MSDWALEFHDSELDSISFHQDECLLHFNSLWLHKRATENEKETGWVQKATIRISKPNILGDKKNYEKANFPISLDGGDVNFNGVLQKNCLLIPIDFKGDINLKIYFLVDTPDLVVTGARMQLILEGEPEFKEYCRHGDSVFTK